MASLFLRNRRHESWRNERTGRISLSPSLMPDGASSERSREPGMADGSGSEQRVDGRVLPGLSGLRVDRLAH